MNKIKKQFEEDFNKSINTDLSFDTNQLEDNAPKTKIRMSPFKKTMIIVSCSLAGVLALVVLVPLSAFLIASLKTDESFKSYRKNYAFNDVIIAESNTFKPLNSITYPNSDRPVKTTLDDEQINAYSNYSYKAYNAIISLPKSENFSFSLINLYAILNELEYAASDGDIKTTLNDLLGLNEENRVSFFDKTMKANFYANNNNTTQIKNSAFLTNRYEPNTDFISALSNLYCEAYQIDFSKESKKMVEWVNEAVDDSKFINEEFLELDEQTVFYLFSTLYFKNAWANKYVNEDNIKDYFYLNKEDTVKTTFMKHSYYVDYYYDYGDYISVTDRYASGGSVTYIVPKNVEDNIYKLTKNQNIFLENEEKAIYGSPLPYDETRKGEIRVNLTMPKFSNSCEFKLNEMLSNLGLSNAFNSFYDSFSKAFTTESCSDNIYLQTVKQKNEVTFNEDGTVVKSVSMAAAGAMSAAPRKDDTIDVTLNQPFIYIIKDVNDTPIFVGHLDNPTKK